MRLSVDLSDFFDDHRSSAWIFINKNMKIISDVENRIFEIFNISNFYLTCEGLYLPPVEDVQIVTETENTSIKVVGTASEITPKSKKKKRNQNEQTTEVEVEIEKKRKRKDIHQELPEIIAEPKPSDGCVKKSRKSTPEKNISEVNTGVDSNSCPSVQRLVSSYEEHKPYNFKEHLNRITFTEDEIKQKKINIIKTVIISGPNKIQEPLNGVEEAATTSLITTNGHWTRASSVSGCSDSQISSVDQTKRKRIRIRKRKRKTPSFTSATIPVIVEPAPPPLYTAVAPQFNGNHIRFDHDEEHRNSLEKIEQNPQDEATLQVLNEELILSQPLTLQIVPKVADVIAFKILRMSEDYTPELSSFIVGSVKNYNEDGKEITFEIIYGLDQCEEPMGKFSIYQLEEDETSEDSRERQFLLQQLVELRLLNQLNQTYSVAPLNSSKVFKFSSNSPLVKS